MKKAAFTLIELIIVVSILGILAAIVIPQVQGNTILAKESAALSSLRNLRGQIELYKMEHDNYPGYASGTATANTTIFTNQLVGISNAAGTSSSATTPTSTLPYGPYLLEIPVNPINNSAEVKMFITTAALADEVGGTSGWLYKVLTGEICINSDASDNAGDKLYYQY